MFKRSLISLVAKRTTQSPNLIPLTSNLKFNTDDEFISFIKKEPKNFSNYLLLLSNNIKNIKKKSNISSSDRETLIKSDSENSNNLYRNIFYISDLLNNNINLLDTLKFNSHSILGSLSSVGVTIQNHPNLCLQLFDLFISNSKNLSSDSIIKGLTSAAQALINKEVISQDRMNSIFDLVSNQIAFQSPDNIHKTLQALKAFGYSFSQLPPNIRIKIQHGFVSSNNMYTEFHLKNLVHALSGVQFSSFSPEFKTTFNSILINKMKPTNYLELSIILNCLVSNNEYSLKNNISRADLNSLMSSIKEEILINPNRSLEAFHKLFHTISISDITWDYLDSSLCHTLKKQFINDLQYNSVGNINYLYGISISLCEFSYKAHKYQEGILTKGNKKTLTTEENDLYQESKQIFSSNNKENKRNFTLINFQDKSFQEAYFKAIFNVQNDIKTKEFNVFLKVISFFNIKFNQFSPDKQNNFRQILSNIYEFYSKDQISYLNNYLNKIEFNFDPTNKNSISETAPSTSSSSPSKFSTLLSENNHEEFINYIENNSASFLSYLRQISQEIKDNNNKKSSEELNKIVNLLENNNTILNLFNKKVSFLLSCFLNDESFNFLNSPNLILYLFSIFTNSCEELDEGAYVRCLRHFARLNLTRQAISNEDMLKIFRAFNKNLKKLSMNEFSKAIDSFYLMGYNFGHFPLEVREKIQDIYIKNYEKLNSYGHYSMIKTIAKENLSSSIVNSQFLDKISISFLNLMNPIQSLHLSYAFYYLVGLGKFPLYKEYSKDELNVLFEKLYQEVLFNSFESFRVILSGLELTEFYFYDLKDELREKFQDELVKLMKKKDKNSLKYFYFLTISLQNLYIKGLNKKNEIEEIEKEKHIGNSNEYAFYTDLTNYTLINLNDKNIRNIYFDYYLAVSDDKNFSLKEFNSFIKLIDLLELSSQDLPLNILESITKFIDEKKDDCHITQKLFFRKIVKKYSLNLTI